MGHCWGKEKTQRSAEGKNAALYNSSYPFSSARQGPGEKACAVATKALGHSLQCPLITRAVHRAEFPVCISSPLW